MMDIAASLAEIETSQLLLFCAFLLFLIYGVSGCYGKYKETSYKHAQQQFHAQRRRKRLVTDRQVSNQRSNELQPQPIFKRPSNAYQSLPSGTMMDAKPSNHRQGLYHRPINAGLSVKSPFVATSTPMDRSIEAPSHYSTRKMESIVSPHLNKPIGLPFYTPIAKPLISDTPSKPIQARPTTNHGLGTSRKDETMNGILQTDELDDDMEFSIEGQSAVESYASGRKRLFLDEEEYFENIVQSGSSRNIPSSSAKGAISKRQKYSPNHTPVAMEYDKPLATGKAGKSTRVSSTQLRNQRRVISRTVSKASATETPRMDTKTPPSGKRKYVTHAEDDVDTNLLPEDGWITPASRKLGKRAKVDKVTIDLKDSSQDSGATATNKRVPTPWMSRVSNPQGRLKLTPSKKRETLKSLIDTPLVQRALDDDEADELTLKILKKANQQSEDSTKEVQNKKDEKPAEQQNVLKLPESTPSFSFKAPEVTVKPSPTAVAVKPTEAPKEAPIGSSPVQKSDEAKEAAKPLSFSFGASSPVNALKPSSDSAKTEPAAEVAAKQAIPSFSFSGPSATVPSVDKPAPTFGLALGVAKEKPETPTPTILSRLGSKAEEGKEVTPSVLPMFGGTQATQSVATQPLSFSFSTAAVAPVETPSKPPSTFSFGAITPATTTTVATAASILVTSTSTTAIQAPLSFQFNATTTSSEASTKQSIVTTPSFSFGSSVPTTTAGLLTTFVSTAATSAPAAPALLSFGSSVPSFGSTAPATTEAAPSIPSFGTPASNVPSFGSTVPAIPSFGSTAPATTAAAPSISSFGGFDGALANPTGESSFSLSSSAPTTQSAAPTFNFGAAPSFGTVTTAPAMPSFGTVTTAPAMPSFGFGSTTAAASTGSEQKPASSGLSLSFGNPASTVAAAVVTTTVENKAAAPTFSFGSTTAVSNASNLPPPATAFGAVSSTQSSSLVMGSIAASPSPFNFSSTTPFGQQNASSSVTPFGQATSNTNGSNTSMMFGGIQPASNGSNAMAPFGQSSAAIPLTGPNNNSVTAFGQLPSNQFTPMGFGQTTAAAPPAFGQPPMAVNAFGTNSSSNPASGNMFGQPPQQQQPPASNAFTFNLPGVNLQQQGAPPVFGGAIGAPSPGGAFTFGAGSGMDAGQSSQPPMFGGAPNQVMAQRKMAQPKGRRKLAGRGR